MPGRPPNTTSVVNASAARQRLSDILNTVYRTKTRVLIERSGIPVAAVVSARDLEHLERLDAERERAFAILEEVGQAFKDVPPDELEAEIAKAIQEVRDERRAERMQAGTLAKK